MIYFVCLSAGPWTDLVHYHSGGGGNDGEIVHHQLHGAVPRDLHSSILLLSISVADRSSDPHYFWFLCPTTPH